MSAGFCPQCGTGRSPDALFCPQCGHRFDAAPSTDRQVLAAAARSGTHWTLGGYLLGFIGLVAGFIIATYGGGALGLGMGAQLLATFIVGPFLGMYLAWRLWLELWAR